MLLISLAALTLRLAALDAKSLWLDEAISFDIASKPVEALIEQRWDPHPPGYYLLLRAWAQLGDSEFWLRWPSAAFGVLSVPAMYWLGRKLHSPRTGLWAALLLAIDPIHVWYSQEARMYAGVALFGMIGVCFAVGLLRRPRQRDWLGFVVAFTLAGYFDYGGLVLWLLTFGGAAMARRQRRVASLTSSWWTAQAAIALLYLPWWPRTIDALRRLIEDGLPNVMNGALARLGVSASVASQLNAWSLAIGLSIGLIALGIVWAGWRVLSSRGRPLSVLARLRRVPAVAYLAWLALAVWPGLYLLKRQALVFLPYLLTVMAATVSGRSRRLPVSVAVGLALVFTLSNLALGSKENWRDAAGLVAEQSRPTDVVLVTPWYTSTPFRYYYDRAPGAAGRVLDANTFEDDGTASGIWVVMGEAYTADASQALNERLHSTREQVNRTEFYRVSVTLHR